MAVLSLDLVQWPRPLLRFLTKIGHNAHIYRTSAAAHSHRNSGKAVPVLLCRDLYIFDSALWKRNRQAIVTHSFNMELDSFTNLRLYLFNRGAGSDTAGQVGNVRGIIVLRLFEHDCVSQKSTSILESSLFQDAVQCAWSKIVTGLSRNSHTSGFRTVLELAVTALGRNKKPSS